ncbi:prepilin-type N-terminal cleavage/methylation domain-containing protein, partial [Staphylococcus epidermidis]
MPIKNIKAFSLVEMIFTLFIISCLLITTLWSRSLFDIQLIDEEYEIKQLITKFN